MLSQGQDKPVVKRFTAQITYKLASGYGCRVGFKDGLNATAKDALFACLGELAWVAERDGLGSLALLEFEARVLEARASLTEGAR